MNSSADLCIDGLRILVVASQATLRSQLADLFESSGWVVDTVSTGEAAIQRIAEQTPDLIVLDAVLAGIDGRLTCQMIQQMEGLQAVPVIFLTEPNDAATVAAAFAGGCADVLAKPFDERELTARLSYHLRARVSNQSQRKYVDALLQANDAKNRALGVAAHDLRNPLASIRGLAEFLAEAGPLNDTQQEISQTIQFTADSMLELVHDLLDLAVIEGSPTLETNQSCSIEAVIRSAISDHQFLAAQKSIRLLVQNQGAPEQVRLNPLHFRRLVNNLLSNAIKFSPRESCVRVILERRGNRLCVIVEDEGPGIPAAEMHQLFTEFGRTSVRPTGNESSTGLGLWICRQIATAQGGRVYAENRTAHRGARFVFELDLRDSSHLQKAC